MEEWKAHKNTIAWDKLNTAWKLRKDTREKEIAAANKHNGGWTGGKSNYDAAVQVCVDGGRGSAVRVGGGCL